MIDIRCDNCIFGDFENERRSSNGVYTTVQSNISRCVKNHKPIDKMPSEFCGEFIEKNTFISYEEKLKNNRNKTGE